MFLLSALSVNTTLAQTTLDINKIIRATDSATSADRRANSAREAEFKKAVSSARSKLSTAKAARVKEEKISTQLDNEIKANDLKIAELQEDLSRELGDLKELFGVIQQSASEAQDGYKTSLISAQYPDRAEELRQMVEKMASLTDLVSISEIEVLWYELQKEMIEQGKIVKYNQPVNFVTEYKVDSEGNRQAVFEAQERTVTRVGVFSGITDNDIVTYQNNVGLVAYENQMQGEFINLSNGLQSSQSGISTFLLDPTKGALLKAYASKPSVDEKVDEGGVVGYLILALGAIAVLIAILKYLMLKGVELRVVKQSKNVKRASLKNPLGRILKVYNDNQSSDPESMELKLGEAMLKESPKLNSWIMLIKIIAVVAPLLGLLGTVTGMIQTFQAITLYGAGDPQTMAGGISKALVTTVLGLVVAIPTVFLHWLVSSRAKRVEEILDEHATGLIAKKYESQ